MNGTRAQPALLPAVLDSMRPRQWTKNLVLFAGVIFAQQLAEPASALRAVAAFTIFCLASGAVYIFNDLVDVEQDRRHPYKRRRPVASGRLPADTAWRVWLLLVVVCLVAAGLLGWPFFTAGALAAEPAGLRAGAWATCWRLAEAMGSSSTNSVRLTRTSRKSSVPSGPDFLTVSASSRTTNLPA